MDGVYDGDDALHRDKDKKKLIPCCNPCRLTIPKRHHQSWSTDCKLDWILEEGTPPTRNNVKNCATSTIMRNVTSFAAIGAMGYWTPVLETFGNSLVPFKLHWAIISKTRKQY